MNGKRHLARKMSASTSSILAVLLLLLGAACDKKDTFQIEQAPGINPWTNLNVNNSPEKFQFAIVTDLTGRLRANVFLDAVKKLNLLQPEFVVTMGDVLEGHTNDKEQLNRQWDELFKAIEPLEMPLFWTPGNHDYWYASSQNAEGAPEQYSMSTVYENRVGRSYYHFLYKNVLFLILNNTMDPSDPEIETEKNYIKKTLEEYPNVRWTFTLFHWSRGFEGRKEEIWEHLAPLLKNRPFTAFGANSHQYVKYDLDAESLFTLNRNRCSRWTRIGVHNGPENAIELFNVILYRQIMTSSIRRCA